MKLVNTLRGKREHMTITIHEGLLSLLDQIREEQSHDSGINIRRSWVVESLLLEHPEVKRRLHG